MAGDTTGGRRWLPEGTFFGPLLADPAQVRNSAALLYTDILRPIAHPAERPAYDLPGGGGNEVQARVGLGFSRPVYRIAADEHGGVDIGFMVGVFTRFRVEQASRDEFSSDWYVGVPLTIREDSWGLRLRVLHHSSHMGDELEQSGVARFEYSWEGADMLLSWSPTPGTRIYGGGLLVARNNSYTYRFDPRQVRYVPVLFTERGALQGGVETEWMGWQDGHLGFTAGLDVQAADRADWRGQYSLVAGLQARGLGREGSLLAHCFSGPSFVGEFFMTRERYCGLEAVVTF